MSFDIVVKGGTVVDGVGTPRYTADLAIQDGRISAIGRVDGNARTVIEAQGRVVSPGFVDVHTHYDAQLMWDPLLSVSPWHGVTTVVIGNCGFGIAPTRAAHRPLIMRTLEKVEGMSYEALDAGLANWSFETFPEYLDAVERKGSAINVGALIGHTPIRMYVLGEELTERAATPDEVARMSTIVRDAIEAGAVGFSTSTSPIHVGYGGRPVPSRLAAFDEIVALARSMGETGKGTIQLTVGIEPQFEQFAQLASASGRPVSWTALLTGLRGPLAHRGFLEIAKSQIAQGLPIYPQVSCRPLTMEIRFREPFSFERLPVFNEVSRADHQGKKALYADPQFRARFKAAMANRDNAIVQALGRSWDNTAISFYEPDPALEERRIIDVARERGVDPIDLALDLALATDLDARFRIPLANDDEAMVEELLHERDPVLALSDAGAHASQLCDACFSTHLLGHWVREKGALTLEDAVRMLTSKPAEVFGIAERGRLAVGLPADVVVFDPETVGAGRLRRVNDLPGGVDRLVADAFGIDAVIVNGTVVRRDGADVTDATAKKAGRLLRNGAAR